MTKQDEHEAVAAPSIDAENFFDKIEIDFFIRLYYIGLVVGGLIRVYFAITGTGIYHPDEIFQSTEMAHYLVYGTGFVPPEFQSTDSSLEYYSKSRSWIIPLLIALYFKIMDFFGFNYYLIVLPTVRLLLALNSLLLVPIIKQLTHSLTGNDRASYLAGFIVAIWWKVAFITSRPLFNVIFLPLLFYSLSLFFVRLKEKQVSIPKGKEFVWYMVGFGIVTYVRIDLMILLASFALVYLATEYKWGNSFDIMIRHLAVSSIPIISGWVFGMAVDALMYDGIQDFGVVPFHWFMFNIVLGHSDIFGTTPYGWYAYSLIVKSGLTTVTGIMLAFTLILAKNLSNGVDLNQKMGIQKSEAFTYLRLFAVTLVSWNIYETPWRNGLLFFLSESHKEERFIMNTYLLYLIVLAYSIILLLDYVDHVLNVKPIAKFGFQIQGYQAYNYMAYFLIFLISFSTFSYLTSSPPYQYGKDINAAIIYVGNQEDLTGLVIVEKWYLTGSYTYLHRSVPIEWINEDIRGQVLNFYLQNSTFNYVIVPIYRHSVTPETMDVLVANGFFAKKVVDGTSEVWFRPS